MTKEKILKFEDESFLRVTIEENGATTITLQAKHLGSNIKTTSATINLKPDEVIELVAWMGQELTDECSNG